MSAKRSGKFSKFSSLRRDDELVCVGAARQAKRRPASILRSPSTVNMAVSAGFAFAILATLSVACNYATRSLIPIASHAICADGESSCTASALVAESTFSVRALERNSASRDGT